MFGESPPSTYHGTQPNEVIREHLKSTHIMAYPSTWMETSCICLMEAMSAGLVCVHPNYGALYETASNWTMMYQWHEDQQMHAQVFHSALREAIINYNQYGNHQTRSMQSYANVFYNWNIRQHQWANVLQWLIESVSDRSLPAQKWSYSS